MTSSTPEDGTHTEDAVDPTTTTAAAQATEVDASAAAPRAKLAPRVFWPSAAVITLFVVLAAVAPKWLKGVLGEANTSVVNGLGWYYVLIVVGFVAVALYAGFSHYGDIVLGKDEDKPRYSLLSWFSMLFAAGMGIGLVFWGVAEPLTHYASPAPDTVAATDPGRAQAAMSTTFLHWGVHAWAIYIVIGLAVAFASHRKGRPMSMRWMLEPLFGDRVKGWVGDLIDIIAVVGTLFGVATSLGFGVTQFSAGLEHLNMIEQNIWWLVGLVAAITLLATWSVVSGVDKGIKWLSTGNLILAGVLMVLVLVLGEPLFVLREFVQSLGDYLQNFIRLSFRTMPYQGEPGETWLGGWTTYYWGWWMSWSPFVGVFIARISKGRTVREFVLGVMLVPTLITFLWFSVLGGTALWKEVIGGGGLVVDGKVDNTAALYQLLDSLPGGPVLIGLFMLLIVVFFVTSSDSASFVVDMIATGGNQNPPVASRIFWSVMEGAIAAVLLWVGASHGALTDGLGALQTMAILAAVPLSVVMVLTCASTLKALHREHHDQARLERRLQKERIQRHVQKVVADEVDAAIDPTASSS